MKAVVWHKRILLVALFAMMAMTAASARHRKLSPELNDKLANSDTSLQDQSGNGSLIEVIIQFRPGAKLDLGISKVLGIGGQHKKPLGIIHGGVFPIPARLFPILAQDPAGTYISPDPKTIKLSPHHYTPDSTHTTSIPPLSY